LHLLSPQVVLAPTTNAHVPSCLLHFKAMMERGGRSGATLPMGTEGAASPMGTEAAASRMGTEGAAAPVELGS